MKTAIDRSVQSLPAEHHVNSANFLSDFRCWSLSRIGHLPRAPYPLYTCLLTNSSLHKQVLPWYPSTSGRPDLDPTTHVTTAAQHFCTANLIHLLSRHLHLDAGRLPVAPSLGHPQTAFPLFEALLFTPCVLPQLFVASWVPSWPNSSATLASALLAYQAPRVRLSSSRPMPRLSPTATAL